MLDRIIELLLGLAVAAAGAIGIGTASTTPPGVGPDVNDVTAKVAWAKLQAVERRADQADSAPADDQVQTNGIQTALDALEQAMEKAPDAADDGLNTAWESVSNAGPPSDGTAGDVPDPAGPPSDLPGPDNHPGR